MQLSINAIESERVDAGIQPQTRCLTTRVTYSSHEPTDKRTGG